MASYMALHAKRSTFVANYLLGVMDLLLFEVKICNKSLISTNETKLHKRMQRFDLCTLSNLIR